MSPMQRYILHHAVICDRRYSIPSDPGMREALLGLEQTGHVKILPTPVECWEFIRTTKPEVE